MKKKLLILSFPFIFTSCSVSDIHSITNAAISKNPSAAFKTLAKSKSAYYASNPKQLSSDINQISSYMKEFVKNISKTWGEDNVKIPKQKEYVKYMQNYKSRASIDFDKGLVYVETLDSKNPKKSLQEAIVTTLLLPDDPRSADLFGAKEIKLGKMPYLYEEVQDQDNKNIRYEWRANRYAKYLIENNLKTKKIDNKENSSVYYVQIPMLKDHANIRVKKFKPMVQKYAKKFNVSENLIYSIIQTESAFNQFAVSGAGAFGLMQIVPSSAGQDSYRYVKGKKWQPTKSYLFDANNNIELGSAYLKILDTKYLAGINNNISREYCVISAYNTGSGNVFKTFSKDITQAKEIINEKTPLDVYNTLIKKLPYEETRNYLKKVVKYKKDFINI